MEIIFSRHAIRRMRERGFESWEVEHLVGHPSYIKRFSDDRVEVFGEMKNRKIKIVYKMGDNYIKIITVI